MKELEEAAKKYADYKSTNGSNNEYYGFIAGAKWAIENNLDISGKLFSEDIVKLRELHGKIFSSNGHFDESDVEAYESLVNKYEGIDLTKIFG